MAERLLLAAAVYALAAGGVYQLVRALRRGRWKELLLAAVSVAAVYLTAELALRRLRPYDSLCRFKWLASARYHHVNPPSRRMFSGYVEGVPVVVETNEDGLRTPHTREEFARHAVRIAVLGDSFVFGSGVNAEETFSSRLEQRLRARGADAAVLDAGVISYSPFLEARQLEGVVSAYRPTLVLLFLDVTDIGDDAIYARKAGSGEFALEGDTDLGCHGAVAQLLQPYLALVAEPFAYPVRLAAAALGHPPRPRGNYYADPVLFEGQPENRYFIYRYPLARTRPFFQATMRNVDAAAAAARRQGAAFALVVFPRYHHWSTRECPQNWERAAYAVDEPYQYAYFQFFDEAATASPFPVLDLLPAFKATTDYPLVFRNDPHWNARGHAFVAEQLEAWLRSRRLAP